MTWGLQILSKKCSQFIAEVCEKSQLKKNIDDEMTSATPLHLQSRPPNPEMTCAVYYLTRALNLPIKKTKKNILDKHVYDDVVYLY